VRPAHVNEAAFRRLFAVDDFSHEYHGACSADRGTRLEMLSGRNAGSAKACLDECVVLLNIPERCYLSGRSLEAATFGAAS
jgi:hypothetical protein